MVPGSHEPHPELQRLLAERTCELNEARKAWTAVSEVLKAMSRGTFELQPILEVLAENAVRLCRAEWALVYRTDGELLRIAAYHNTPRELMEWLSAGGRGSRITPGDGSVSGTAAADRRTIHITDILAEQDYPYHEAQKLAGFRAALGVPMVRDDRLVGVFFLARNRSDPFTEAQIELVTTFADQAVIAIENVRLFTELEMSNREITEALEHQTASAEILQAISQSPTDLQPVLDILVRAAARFCNASDVQILQVEGDVLRGMAGVGRFPEVICSQLGSLHALTIPINRGSVSGRSVIDQRTVHVHDLASESESEYPEGLALQRRFGHRTMVSSPLLREGTPLGCIGMFRMEVAPFTEKQLELLRVFADQAVIAIDNVRLFRELEERNREVTDALERQTATSRVLGVISSSPTDAQPVFDMIAESAVRLCGAQFSTVYRFDGELVRLAGHWGLTPEGLKAWKDLFPRVAAPDTTIGRAILDRDIALIPDVDADSEFVGIAVARAVDFRSLVSIPMMQKGRPVGGITVAWKKEGAVPDKQLDLLRTFANQAVIAIENVRLFGELQQRTDELTRSVDQLTALGEIGRVVNSTLDPDQVLQTIARRAVDLSNAQGGVIYEFDESTHTFEARSTHQISEAHLERLRAAPIRMGEGATGRAGVTREPVAVADIRSKDQPVAPQVRDQLVAEGLHALLAIPLLRDRRVLGGLVIVRREPGEFSPDVVALLTTFAAQSAVAIYNARLFREIEEKGHQLEIASRHKSQFLANMSHELRTPLNAILGYTELISDEIYGPVPDEIREVLGRVEHNGRHLLELINSVLDISKIEAGRLVLNLDTYSMRDLVRETVVAVEPLASGKNLALNLEVPDDLAEGRADAARIRQVLLNLLGNAIKFTESGSVTVEVTTHGGEYQVSVTDTGPGISAEDQGRIFDEFQQVDDSNTREKGGTGLGLAITRKILELHGGGIGVESTPGQGSNFRFHLPVKVDRSREVA